MKNKLLTYILQMQKQSSTQSVPKLPKAQFGMLTPPADINRYDNIPKPSSLNKQAQEILTRRNTNRPTISQYTPKPGDQERMNAAKDAYRAEQSKLLNRAASSRVAAKAMENIVEPMLAIEMGMAAGKLAKPTLEAAGKYLTENTALKNAYKLNPYAFKANPEAYYRMIGKEGYTDALNSGVIRPPKTQGYTTQHVNAYYNKGYPLDINFRNATGRAGYEGPYMAEVKGNKDLFVNDNPQGFTGPMFDDPIYYSKQNIPIGNSDVKLYKENWLKRYKEVSKPTDTQIITRGPINYWEEPGFAKRNPNFNPEVYANSPAQKFAVEDLPENLMPFMERNLTKDKWKAFNSEQRRLSTNYKLGYDKYDDGGIIVDPMGQWAHPGEVTRIPGDYENNKTNITMKDVNYPVLGIGSNGKSMMMYPEQDYEFGGASYVDEYPMMGKGGEMIRRADGSYSKRGLWDNIRANKGSGKKPTKEMLEQERKIKAKSMEKGGTNNPGFEALPEYVQAKILSQMGYGGYYNPYMEEGGEPNGGMALGQIMAVADKMSKLRQFISPEENLDPWIASKLAVMDDSAAAIADYMMYNPEAQGEGGEEEMGEENEQEGEEEKMANGGYVVTRSNDRKGKTHKVTGPDGTVKYFGDSKLGQHPKDPERKKAFYARHKKNLENNPFFRAFARKTWEEGGSTFSGNAWYGNGGTNNPGFKALPDFVQHQILSNMAYGGIHINPANKGKFTESAQRAGMGVQEFASKVLANKEDYSSTQVKRANFARNAAGWNKANGGPVTGQEMDVTPEELEMLRQQGYQFEIL
jgi:hypothetical protein